MKFKVGDIVRVTGTRYTGKTGTVVSVDDGNLPYNVRFDKPYCYTFWTNKENLELIEEEHMTYKEFEEWVEEQGWGCEYDDLIIEVINLNNKLPIGIVGKSTMYKLNTLYSEFTILDGSKKRELYNKMTKLASTPLDKRVEVKTMTLEEIEQELGYKVKIKGEK